MQRILIVDDDPDLRETLKSFLQDEDYIVDDSASGQETLTLAESHYYSVILIDIYLPDINGIDLVEKLKERGTKAQFVVITGSSEIQLARKAIKIGVFDYLVKPFKNHQLSQVLKSAIMQNSLREELENLEKQKALYQEELERMVDQKVAELKESELKYHNLVEQSLVGVYISQDNVFKYVNKKMCEIFECSVDDLIDQKNILTFADIEHTDDNPEFRIINAESIETPGSYKLKAISLEKKPVILEIWAGEIKYQGKPAIEGVVHDVTEEEEAKERHRQYELQLINEHKMAAIGQLAAGIAHNLNTPISIIQGNAELLQLKNQDNEELRKILNQTGRMTKLIETIMRKGKKEQEHSKQKIKLNELLERELDFLHANLYFKHQIEKHYDFAQDIPEIEGIYSDFSQSILNIIQNAVDAMYKAPQRKLEIKIRLVENHIELSISDTGCGIDEVTAEKIFNPFFTTKPAEPAADTIINPNQPVGTGLGLSLVYNLLYPYGVKIDFYSVINQGTTFTLKIPTALPE